MKKLTFSLLVAGLLTCSFFITSCTNKSKQEQSEEHDATKKDSAQAVVYTCSMHPEVTGKEGDTCSKCGMKLDVAVKTSDSTAVEHHH